LEPARQLLITLLDSFWLLLWRAIDIGPMSADQHKKIGIRRGATSVNIWSGLIEQNGNFEKSQEMKGRSEKFKNPLLFLVRT
jgi:hypothetical protein